MAGEPLDLTNGNMPTQDVPAAAPAAAPAAPEPVAAAPAGVQADAPPATGQPIEAAAAPAADAPAAVAQPEPSLFSTAKVAEGEKPPEAAAAPATAPAADPAPTDAKPPEPAAAAPPAEQPVAEQPAPTEQQTQQQDPAPPAVEALEYKFTLPETMTLSDDQRTELNGVMDAYRADPSNLQPLVDYHHKMMGALHQQVQQGQIDAFNAVKKEWHTASMADEQIGGARHQTAMNNVALARDTFASSHPSGSEGWQKDIAELNQLLDYTGLGNHPVFLRMMDNAARYIREPSAPSDTNVKIPQQRAGGRGALYDNPRSAQLNGGRR